MSSQKQIRSVEDSQDLADLLEKSLAIVQARKVAESKCIVFKVTTTKEIERCS